MIFSQRFKITVFFRAIFFFWVALFNQTENALGQASCEIALFEEHAKYVSTQISTILKEEVIGSKINMSKVQDLLKKYPADSEERTQWLEDFMKNYKEKPYLVTNEDKLSAYLMANAQKEQELLERFVNTRRLVATTDIWGSDVGFSSGLSTRLSFPRTVKDVDTFWTSYVNAMTSDYPSVINWQRILNSLKIRKVPGDAKASALIRMPRTALGAFKDSELDRKEALDIIAESTKHPFPEASVRQVLTKNSFKTIKNDEKSVDEFLKIYKKDGLDGIEKFFKDKLGKKEGQVQFVQFMKRLLDQKGNLTGSSEEAQAIQAFQNGGREWLLAKLIKEKGFRDGSIYWRKIAFKAAFYGMAYFGVRSAVENFAGNLTERKIDRPVGPNDDLETRISMYDIIKEVDPLAKELYLPLPVKGQDPINPCDPTGEIQQLIDAETKAHGGDLKNMKPQELEEFKAHLRGGPLYSSLNSANESANNACQLRARKLIDAARKAKGQN